MAPIRFSADDGMDFAVRCLLTGIGYGMADPGEVLATAESVVPGDPGSWFDAWSALGDTCEAIAVRAEAAGHRESAAQAWLRAANYRFAGFYYVLATDDPGRHDEAWRAHRRALEGALANWATGVERLAVPWDGGALEAWWFRAAPWGGPGPRPVMVVHNGLGSPLSDVMMTGVVDAVARGWHAVAFDGPGQGRARFVDGLGPVDDWERVGAAVLDVALARPDVDADRVVVAGISDGGYLAARHAARDRRIAALVCDPGVVRPVEGVLGGLPDGAREAWHRAGAAGVDEFFAGAAGPDDRFAAAKAVEQWPGATVGEVLARLRGWDLADVASSIACPVLVCDPDDAASFPGQSRELAGLLGDLALVVPFTTAEGAGLDCEIGAPRLRNQRVFDQLDEWLGHDAETRQGGTRT